MTREWVDDWNLFDKRKTLTMLISKPVNPSIKLSNTIVTVVIA